MLKQLNIENVAVIEKATVDFSDGLNILTGETGAGKSILIDSINAILGNRTSKEIVRNGAERATIWASFLNYNSSINNVLEQASYPVEDELFIYREITADGKSICRVNNRPATAAFVREVCSALINIHGQHDNQILLNSEKHIEVFDNFAELVELKRNYQDDFKRLVLIKKEIEQLSLDDQQKTNKKELLSYQIDEIEKACLEPNEEQVLTEKRNLIRNSENLISSISAAHGALSNSDEISSACDLLYTAVNSLEAVSGVSDELLATYNRLNEAYYSVRDISDELSDMIDRFEFNPLELEETEQRLDVIYNLKRKYGDSIQAILENLEQQKKELGDIDQSDERLEALKVEYKSLLSVVTEKGGELSEQRKQKSILFCEKIISELQFLNMPGVVFTVSINQSKLTINGIDEVEFLISTNPGEPPKPLSKIASGGELSRIMLAIKNALADKDEIDSLIFDEIDTGISGVSANRVGRKLLEVSASRQTICVTHSAGVASYANRHMKIEKNVNDGKTYTDISLLDEQQRKYELARIISGDNITETSLKNAQELIETAAANSL